MDNKGTRAIAKRTVQIGSDGTGVNMITSHLLVAVYEKDKIL